jgi:hypothetical protein
MPRKVLKPGQDDEAAPGGFGCKRTGPTGRLVRYYAACYVEIPWDERQRALRGDSMEWFGKQTTRWIADECDRTGSPDAEPEPPKKKTHHLRHQKTTLPPAPAPAPAPAPPAPASTRAQKKTPQRRWTTSQPAFTQEWHAPPTPKKKETRKKNEKSFTA